MARKTADKPAAKLGHDDVRRICGDVVDSTVEAIIETGATLEELEEAIAWASGEDDVMGEERKPLTGRAAEVYDILAADEEFAEDERRP